MNILKALTKTMENMHEQMGDFHREMETLVKNHMLMQEKNNSDTEMMKVFTESSGLTA